MLEHHFGDVRRTIGAQHAASVITILIVVCLFEAAQNLIQVALGANNLLGTECAIFVCTARAREGGRIHDKGLACRVAICGLRDEGLGHHGFGRLESRLADGKLAAFPLFIDDRCRNGRLRLRCKRTFHEGFVLRSLDFTLFAISHDASWYHLSYITIQRAQRRSSQPATRRIVRM